MTMNEAYAPTKTFKTSKGEEFTRRLYSIDNEREVVSIFNSTKVNFLNSNKKKCFVSYAAKSSNGSVYLEIVIPTKIGDKTTKMSLDRFLYLVEIGDFLVTTSGFNERYMRPYKK